MGALLGLNESLFRDAKHLTHRFLSYSILSPDELELAAADDELSDLVELSAADELLSAGAADELSAGADSADEDSADEDSAGSAADELSSEPALS